MKAKQKLLFCLIVISIFLLTTFSCIKGEHITLSKKGSFEQCEFAFDVHVKDNLAIIGDAGGGVWITDVSDLANPIVLSRILNPGIDHSVYIEDEILFVADWSNGLRIFNISTPSNPQHLSQLITGFEVGFVVSGNNIVCIGDPNLSIINVTDLAAPSMIYRDLTQTIIDGVIIDTTLFCLDSYSGLIILDIGDPAAPIELGSWITSGILYLEIEIRNDVAFITSNSGLKALNISNLQNPIEIELDASKKSTKGLGIEEDLLYLSEDNTDIRIYNISNIDEIEEVGHYSESSITINSIFVTDGIIYATSEYDGLQIIGPETNINTTSSRTNEAYIAPVFIVFFGSSTIYILNFRKRKELLERNVTRN